MRNHFGHDHLRDGDAADLAADHFLGRRLRPLEIQIDLHQAEFEPGTERFMGLDHQLGFLEPFIGLAELRQFIDRRDDDIVGDRDAPLLHQPHPGTFEHLRHA
jgi:hypothetical protein